MRTQVASRAWVVPMMMSEALLVPELLHRKLHLALLDLQSVIQKEFAPRTASASRLQILETRSSPWNHTALDGCHSGSAQVLWSGIQAQDQIARA